VARCRRTPRRLNADDPLASAQAARSRARRLLFGLSPAADVRGSDVRPRPAGYAFRLRAPQGEAELEVAGLAETAVQNARAACAGALAAGAPLADLAPGLAAYAPVRGRLQPLALDGDLLVVDDTYNANPQSMEVALRALAQPRGERGPVRRIAVLGDMGELGRGEPGAPRVGALAPRSHRLLFAVGAHAGEVAEAARAGGPGYARHVEPRGAAATRARGGCRRPRAVKGSRSAHGARRRSAGPRRRRRGSPPALAAGGRGS
jgi:UDP-N-acetylmuramoyl-tripeptide--D-alanyl-D-alanine ligase